MISTIRKKGVCGLFFLLTVAVAGCAATENPPPKALAFKEALHEIALLPVEYTEDYRMIGGERAPYPVDIREDLRKKVAQRLESLGYTVVPEAPPGLPAGAGAAMRVLIDFFIYDAWEPDRSGLILIQALAEMRSPSGELLWKDKASARAEEFGKPLGFAYPHAETLRVLSSLADRLVDSLPPAGQRR